MKYQWTPGGCDHTSFFKNLLFFQIVVKYKEYKIDQSLTIFKCTSSVVLSFKLHILWKKFLPCLSNYDHNIIKEKLFKNLKSSKTNVYHFHFLYAFQIFTHSSIIDTSTSLFVTYYILFCFFQWLEMF